MASNMTFGLVQNGKSKEFDASRYYDPAHHPLRNITRGKLFTIDRGSRYRGEHRYWTATDTLGSDGVAEKIATLGSNGAGYDSFSRIYDEAERVCKNLGPYETAFISIPGGRGLRVTRVR